MTSSSDLEMVWSQQQSYSSELKPIFINIIIMSYQVLPFFIDPGVGGAVEKEEKGGLTGTGGLAEAGTE